MIDFGEIRLRFLEKKEKLSQAEDAKMAPKIKETPQKVDPAPPEQPKPKTYKIIEPEIDRTLLESSPALI